MLRLIKAKLRFLLLFLLLVIALSTAGILRSAHKATYGNGVPTVEEAPKQLIPLEEFVVNLADTREAHYLKVEIVLETRGAMAKEELHKNKAQVRDAVIAVLSSKSYYDILESKGKEALKDEVKKVLDEVLEESVITGVFFNSLTMQ